MVSGNYVNKFAEASHVLFDGNLDNLSFRSIAIQKLKHVDDKTITTNNSTTLNINKQKSRERVKLIYKCFLFGNVATWGYPFKDGTCLHYTKIKNRCYFCGTPTQPTDKGQTCPERGGRPA